MELLEKSTLEGEGGYIAQKMNNMENRTSAGRHWQHSPQKKRHSDAPLCYLG
jgi:hypothetical protein